MKQLLSEAIDDYMYFRKSTDVAKRTISNQGTVLRQFLTTNGNIWVHQISHNHVSRHFTEAGKTKSPASLNNDFGALNGFFDWARETKRMAMDNNPMYGRRRPKMTKRERNRVHVSKFPALLDAAEARCDRDRAALAVLLYTLLRDGEVTSLRLRDVDLEAGYLMVVRHKTRTEDRVPICAELDAELRRWLTVYTEEVGHLEPGFFLVPARATELRFRVDGNFDTPTHGHLKPSTHAGALGRIVTPILRDIDFPVETEEGKKLYEGAHTIRRSGARALFDRLVADGYDHSLRIVQSMLGHSSVQQTERYIGLSADRLSRDQLLRGKPMYALPTENVTDLRSKRDDGQEERDVAAV